MERVLLYIQNEHKKKVVNVMLVRFINAKIRKYVKKVFQDITTFEEE